jgi:nucleotide-binding universal stress UspA family protein
MAIRTILAAAGGGTATLGAIDLGCRLAGRFAAHLEGFHVRPDPRAMLAAAGEDIVTPPSAALIAGAIEEAAAAAARTRALFDDTVGRHGIAHLGVPQPRARGPSALWREATGSAPSLIAGRGRFFDLVVLGRSARVLHEPYSETIERTLLGSGRPVLLAPAEPPCGIGHRVAVAWNGSPEAVRALAAALPFLEKAEAVSLLVAGGEGEAADDGRAAADYLAWHGVAAERRPLAAGAGRRAGPLLIAAAAAAGADLLVMGAYGRKPWREELFGGATRGALAAMRLPLLLMH